MTPPFKGMSFERVVCKFVTAQGDPRLGLAHPDLSYDSLHFFRTAGAGVNNPDAIRTMLDGITVSR